MKLLKTTVCILALAVSACGGKKEQTSEQKGLSGEVRIDGSSTVYPISEAVAEEFRAVQPDVKVTVGLSGTGGGFKKFTRGETDINNASRNIKQEEMDAATASKIGFLELKVAYDGLTVVVNPENNFVSDMTVEELKKMWEPEAQGKITKWSQVRAGWPDQEFRLYGAGTESGTYDYFTEAIVGKSHSSRGDYTASEDDNVLVKGITTDKNGLAFFGYAYYEENSSKLKSIGIDDGKPDNGAGPIKPSLETVKNKSYAPLSRPLYIYVNSTAVMRPEVTEFVRFYLQNAGQLATDVGFIPMTDEEYKAEIAKFEAFIKEHTAK
ncbi:MAG: PstS family phosphate ABC transporter substrate-binding protein [Bacteroidota bacterium]|jgi:phosphate transport system substrate-binding protein